MLAVMAVASMALFAVAVIAPEAAHSFDVAPTAIGAFTGIAYISAMIAGTLTGSFIDYFGAIRTCQLALLCAAAGLLALTYATLPSAVLSALLLGLAYGQLNPVSAHILVNLGEARWRPLIFSIKQTGVPAGGMLAGLLVPIISQADSWRSAMVVVAVMALVVLILIQPLRRQHDHSTSTSTNANSEPRKTTNLLAPLRSVLAQRDLRGATLVAFAYAGCQISVGAFFVVYLVEALAMSLVQAGLVFAFVQAGGIVGRLFWGALAGRWLSPFITLAGLGLLTATCLVITALLTSAWPLMLIILLGFILGACSFGWNGVFLAEVARLAPSGEAGAITGGVQFIMFGGVVVVPPCFGLLVGLSNYGIAFSAVALLATVAGSSLLINSRAQ